MPMRKDMYSEGLGGQGGTWTMMPGSDLDEERPGPRGAILSTARKRDLDHSYEERDLDHGYEEGPGPGLRGGTWTTAERRDLDHGYEEGPGPRLLGRTWTTATRRDLDHGYEEGP
ncbi:hypothetical protein RRG08_038486 [Elysia crispata]|uniref:Uncharacterized protein n=1 Tax=Elysia crispata TaxID=231223 RepID=A0AAE1AII8_9GAST|nr:hypothetical protein RRG08_038486 [Elysia crispata]